MTEASIIQAIAEYLGLSPEDIDRQTSLRQDLSLGPVEINDLLANLSSKFDVVFESEDIEHIDKIEDLVVLIEDNSLE